MLFFGFGTNFFPWVYNFIRKMKVETLIFLTFYRAPGIFFWLVTNWNFTRYRMESHKSWFFYYNKSIYWYNVDSEKLDLGLYIFSGKRRNVICSSKISVDLIENLNSKFISMWFIYMNLSAHHLYSFKWFCGEYLM